MKAIDPSDRCRRCRETERFERSAIKTPKEKERRVIRYIFKTGKCAKFRKALIAMNNLSLFR